MVKELTGKKLLEACRGEKQEIIMLLERRDQIMSTLLPKARRLKDTRVQESIDMDPMGEVMAEVEELDKEIERQIQRMLRNEVRARKMLEKIKDWRYRQMFNLYYLSTWTDEHGNIKRYTWDRVAKRMDYSPEAIYKFMPKAYSALRKVYREVQ